MKHSVSLTVNGSKQAADVEPRLLLVHFLRDTLGLTGTNVGCDTSQCGACTVFIDGQAVKSCTVLTVAGRRFGRPPGQSGGKTTDRAGPYLGEHRARRGSRQRSAR